MYDTYMSTPGNTAKLARNCTQQHTDSTKRSVPSWKRTYNALVCILPSQHSTHYASQACRQMSGGRFLVSANDVNCSEKIVKNKSHAKERINIDGLVRPKETIANESELISSVKTSLDDMNTSTLTEDTKQVVNHVAEYIAKKQRKVETTVVNTNCCMKNLLIVMDTLQCYRVAD